MSIDLFLTMAGRYTRFKDEGFQIPKYLLPWGDKSILSEILLNINLGFFDNVFLVGNSNDERFMPHVRSIMKSYNIPVGNLFLIDDTGGQAESAFVGINRVLETLDVSRDMLFFHNVDTVLYNRGFRDVNQLLSAHGGYVDVFRSNNHSYSYVVVDDGVVSDIVEKVVVSDLATSGLYGFSSVDRFLGFYRKGDVFISEVYRRMIGDGCSVVTGVVHSEKDTIVLGTPNEYLSSMYMLDLMNNKLKR